MVGGGQAGESLVVGDEADCEESVGEDVCILEPESLSVRIAV